MADGGSVTTYNVICTGSIRLHFLYLREQDNIIHAYFYGFTFYGLWINNVGYL